MATKSAKKIKVRTSEAIHALFSKRYYGSVPAVTADIRSELEVDIGDPPKI
jgi:hypothetical protein